MLQRCACVCARVRAQCALSHSVLLGRRGRRRFKKDSKRPPPRHAYVHNTKCASAAAYRSQLPCPTRTGGGVGGRGCVGRATLLMFMNMKEHMLDSPSIYIQIKENVHHTCPNNKATLCWYTAETKNGVQSRGGYVSQASNVVKRKRTLSTTPSVAYGFYLSNKRASSLHYDNATGYSYSIRTYAYRLSNHTVV